MTLLIVILAYGTVVYIVGIWVGQKNTDRSDKKLHVTHIKCPSCLAKPHEYCHDIHGNEILPHLFRIRAAGLCDCAQHSPPTIWEQACDGVPSELQK